MRIFAVIVLTLLMFSSCKAKYEELLSRYNITKNKKKEAINSRKMYEGKIASANDSIQALLPEYRFWKRYSTEAAEIAALKSDFIKKNLKP